MQRIVITVVLAASFAGAFADELPALPTDSFVSTKTRAEVQAELAEYQKAGVNPWSICYNPLKSFHSTKTRARSLPSTSPRATKCTPSQAKTAAPSGCAPRRTPRPPPVRWRPTERCEANPPPGLRPRRASGAHRPRVVLRRAVGTALLRAAADGDASHPAWACARAPLAHAERRGRLRPCLPLRQRWRACDACRRAARGYLSPDARLGSDPVEVAVLPYCFTTVWPALEGAGLTH